MSSKNVFENILKTMVSLLNISQALGNPSQQNDYLFRLSQTIIESFNRGEHVVAAFLDVQKAFDNCLAQ